MICENIVDFFDNLTLRHQVFDEFALGKANVKQRLQYLCEICTTMGSAEKCDADSVFLDLTISRNTDVQLSTPKSI